MSSWEGRQCVWLVFSYCFRAMPRWRRQQKGRARPDRNPFVWVRFARRLGRLAVLLLLGACDDAPRGIDKASERPPEQLCKTGLSEDPPRSQLDLGIRLLADKEYKKAEQLFGGLAASFPGSATLRVYRGDAILFDKSLDEQLAAQQAQPHFDEASRLHDNGCTLPRRPLYYLWMDQTYAALRLAKGKAGFNEQELSRAERVLKKARSEFPTSAEIPYNAARVACARVSSAEPMRADSLRDDCYREFETALVMAESLDRPRFLRTHRSTQDWIVRSRSQSEFGPLRELLSYEKLIQRALAGDLAEH